MEDDSISGQSRPGVNTERVSGEASYQAAPHRGAGYEDTAFSSDYTGVWHGLSNTRKVEGNDSRATTGRSNISYPEERDAIRRFWEKAKDNATMMVEAAGECDIVKLATSSSELDYLLQDLWDLRKAREKDWGGVVNFLQGVLKKADVEKFTQAQCQAVRTIVTDLIGPATVNRDDVETCLRVLRGAGLDPWRPISEHEER